MSINNHVVEKSVSRAAVTFLAILVGGFLSTLNAGNNVFAAVVATQSTNTTSQLFFGADNTDLIDNSQLGISLLSVSHVGYSPFGTAPNTSTAAALNDGVVGATSDITTVAFSATNPSGSPVIPWTSTYTFDTSIYDQGYTITEIETTAGWLASRSGQGYTIRYTTIDNPTLQVLGSFSATAGSSGDRSTLLHIEDTDTGFLLQGVTSIQFDVTNATPTYREFDVFGFGVSTPPFVPEPSSLSLMGSALLALLHFRRRNRKDARNA